MRTFQRSLVLSAVLALLLIAPTAASALTQTDLDTSYGGTGTVTPALPAVDDKFPVAVQSDGKLVGAYVTTGGAPMAYRLNLDGSLDGSFGTGGKVDLAVLGATGLSIQRVLVAGDGSIYVVGDGSVAGFSRVAIWALTTAGAPRLGFNATGSRLLPVVAASNNNIGDAVLTASGEVAVAADAAPGADTVISLRVVTTTGTVTTDIQKGFAGYDAVPTSIMLLPDGRFVVAASLEGTTDLLSGLMVFSAAGVFDASFGGGGVALFGPPIPLYSVAFKAFNLNGGIGALGMVGYAASAGILTTTGYPIPEIGSNGVSRILPPGASFAFSVDGGAVGSGKFVAVGIVAGVSSLSPYLVRYNPDASADTSFTPGGVTYLPVPAGSSPQFALQPDGKYVIAVRKPDDALSFVRIWGDAPAPQPATVAFSASVKSRQKASKAKRFAGTTGGTGISKVELAIQKVDSKLLKKSKKCTYVKSKSAKLKNYKAVSGKCAPGIWLTANGTGTWSVKLSKALKPGKYVLSARSTGVLGLSSVATKSITLTK
ncbi:MAG: hypothetical protein JHC98_05125 [Thermoleophilaceae bacterium]|nr:hypothetical protein [Thermoleophilaceae bacterium]